MNPYSQSFPLQLNVAGTPNFRKVRTGDVIFVRRDLHYLLARPVRENEVRVPIYDHAGTVYEVYADGRYRINHFDPTFDSLNNSSSSEGMCTLKV